MDFTLTEAATDLRVLAHDIAAKISTPDRVAELEATNAPIDGALWSELAAAGLLALEFPSSLDDAGADLSIVESVTVAEQLGAALARVPFGAHAIAALPVLARHGSPHLRSTLAPAAAAGEGVLAVAVEEDLGTDPGAPHTTLTVTGDGMTLSGTKVNVAYAQAATDLLVTADGAGGVVTVVISADAPGVRIVDTPATGKTPTAVVEFTDVTVAEDAVLTGGAQTVRELVTRYALAICADQCGVLSAALAATAAYAVEREQFGRPIGSFQAVAQRIADGYIDVAGLTLTTTQAAWLFARDVTPESPDTHASDEIPDEVTTAVATAKFWACDSGHRVAHTAVHVHGGVGLDTTHLVHRYFLRAKQNEFTMGSAPVTLARIGDALADAPA